MIFFLFFLNRFLNKEKMYHTYKKCCNDIYKISLFYIYLLGIMLPYCCYIYKKMAIESLIILVFFLLGGRGLKEHWLPFSQHSLVLSKANNFKNDNCSELLNYCHYMVYLWKMHIDLLLFESASQKIWIHVFSTSLHYKCNLDYKCI